jgi:hypothetical protein
MASNFDRLAGKLASKPGVTDPKGLAAYIGDRKFSKGVMQKAASKGVSAASVAKK